MQCYKIISLINITAHFRVVCHLVGYFSKFYLSLNIKISLGSILNTGPVQYNMILSGCKFHNCFIA